LKTKYTKASGAGGRKIPKTLSGIETLVADELAEIYRAGKYLKPYQGLKQVFAKDFSDVVRAGKYLKPYQGLKRILGRLNSAAVKPENT